MFISNEEKKRVKEALFGNDGCGYFKNVGVITELEELKARHNKTIQAVELIMEHLKVELRDTKAIPSKLILVKKEQKKAEE